MSFTPEQIQELEAPLNRENVRVRSKMGTDLSYIEGWRVIDEANRIFGFGKWTRDTVELTETNRDLVSLTNKKQWRVGFLARVRIVACGVSREGVGFGSGMSKPEAIGDAIESACKEAETDAMKRAMMTFGNPFGLALYDKKQANVATPHPMENDKAARYAIFNAIKNTGITEGAKVKELVEGWIQSLGVESFEDTKAGERQSYVNDILGGKYASTEASSDD